MHVDDIVIYDHVGVDSVYNVVVYCVGNVDIMIVVVICFRIDVGVFVDVVDSDDVVDGIHVAIMYYVVIRVDYITGVVVVIVGVVVVVVFVIADDRVVYCRC